MKRHFCNGGGSDDDDGRGDGDDDGDHFFIENDNSKKTWGKAA